MPNPSLEVGSPSFFTQLLHMLPGGQPEPVTAQAPPSGMPPGPPVPAPPILEGLYRMLYPTPAETGELPSQYWPKQPAQPTGASVAASLYPSS